ncbi:MAG TPA: adenylate/guanylate cyclase domain-containing protein [Acidimicrobiales bacterium]|jgi:adenylate cyclase|nr:adenylate/guanylate cyclase domain-containing protein [Acidimicrobiales bacterium]
MSAADAADSADSAGADARPARGGKAREAGAATFAALRRATARKAAELIRSDPDDAATALEIGLVDEEWLQAPGERPISSSAPGDILRRFVERTVERHPSKLSSLGLTAVQLLSSGDDNGGDGGKAPAKTLTVVFTDLEGFTAYTDTHGDAAALTLIGEHHQRATPTVRRWRGRIVKHLGDGLLCTFPKPALGVRAALDLQASAPDPLRLRAGVHMGEATVTRSDVVGHVVNVAARVCEVAKGGQVLATAEVVEAATSGNGLPEVRLGRMKSRRMKGIKTPVRLCEVRAAPEPGPALEA